MFSELLSQMEQTLKTANASISEAKNQIQQCRAENPDTGKYFHDPTKKLGKITTFCKTQRFKPVVKEQPNITSTIYQQPSSTKQSQQETFSKANRFEKQKQDDRIKIEPKYESIKPSSKGQVKMHKPTELADSRLTQATISSFSNLGPATYFPAQPQYQEQNKPTFSKSRRFKVQLPQTQTPLYPSDTYTKPNIPTSTILKPKQQKTKHLLNKQQQEQMRERLKMVYWKTIPLELDRLWKNNSAPIMKEKYFQIRKLTGVERKCAMMMMLERLNYERGGFDGPVRSALEDKCGVVYRKSTPKPFKFSEMEPGPDYYYPHDDIIKPKPIVFSFGKQEEKAAKIDQRDYEIKQDIMKKGGNIIINPEPTPHKLSDWQLRNMYLGFYDCLFSQVEKRTDTGLVKYQPITKKNARENNCVEVKEVNDGIYYPKYTELETNVSVPLYKEPTNHKPPNVPDSEVFPEHWLFYDGDLNKVRAQIGKNVILAKNMAFKQYNRYVKQFNLFKKYLNEQKYQPQIGEYQVKYEGVDPHVPNYQMQKQPEKTLIEPIKKSQDDVDGDNLILNPNKIQDKLPAIDFGKMVGRDDGQIDRDAVKQGDVLILQPKKPEKKVADIIFEKMAGREQQGFDEEPPEGDRLILNPNHPPPHLQNLPFEKQPERPSLPEDDRQLIIDPKQPQKIKGFVQMSRMSSYRLVPYLRKQKEGQEPQDQKNQ